MTEILADGGKSSEDAAKELDCLIYRSFKDDGEQPSEENGANFWEASKENISVQVWEEKAKIRVKVTPKIKGNISMKRIASIAVDAILKELKKEE